jgi:hypothetical protein
MKIGVLGSGTVAKVLAAGFLKHGHQVTVGTRTPAKLSDWAAQNPSGSVGSFAAAAVFGEVVVLAVKGKVAVEALLLAGADNLFGKPVIDATNPIEDAPPINGVLPFFTNLNASLMEQLQREFASAHFVKAFNSVGAASMVNPEFKEGKPTMFICGNSESAKKTVSGILDQFGWETADMGKAEAARAIEPLCMLWCIPGLTRNQWTHAFKLLTK